ncbi:MAG TPA: YicC/YloC family endoribonuclease [Caldimonas sp.]|nr:YicC/YloC family endoribonuclease [Caldimonas sp.]
MTGYANASASAPAASAAALHEASRGSAAKASPAPAFAVEIRSVNGRFLDIAMRLPDELRGLEPALRAMLTARFKRGKIELRLSGTGGAEGSVPEPTPEQLAHLARVDAGVREHLPQARALSVHEALQWCRGAPEAQPEHAVLAAAELCVERLAVARAREGERLSAVLAERVAHLRELASAAEPLVPGAVARMQQRFLERWKEALDKAGAAQSVTREAIEERALNEAAAYAIRIDVAEELARLRSHLDEIARLLDKGGEIGKRLEFIIQELLREANTLGSKSPSIEMTAISVDMKVAIEQLREQVQNVE